MGLLIAYFPEPMGENRVLTILNKDKRKKKKGTREHREEKRRYLPLLLPFPDPIARTRLLEKLGFLGYDLWEGKRWEREEPRGKRF